MNWIRLSCLAGLLVVVAVLVGCGGEEVAQAPVPLIPMEDFFKNPDKTGYQLSPDGEHFAFLMPWEGRLNVHVQKVSGSEITRVTEATERDIFGFLWLNNRRIGWVQDKGGNENWHAYGVDIDGENYLDATPFEGVQVQFVDRLENDDAHILIAMNKRVPQIFDVYRLNVDSGDLQVVAENPGNITEWYTDHDGQLRVAVATDGVNMTMLYRSTEQDAFRPVATTSFKETLSPQFFTFDNRHLYVLSNIDRDKEAIYTFDPETGQHLDLVFEHPDVDVGGLLRSRKRKVVTGAWYVSDKRHYEFFDAEREKLFRFLENKLPGYEVVLTGRSKDERKLMVRTFSDRSRGAYYYHDLDTGEFSKVVEVTPWINEEEMASMRPIKYQSRDGLTINGYLTLPVGVDPEGLPVVINPHGGPWARDNWGFNPEVQFLANRGYAVLQMNFRGSTGYGKEFWTSSFKQWGKKMQDDISDGVAWVVDEGIADPQRVGIYGGSYGGYATLAGLTFTPDLYACGVDYVGVSNIFTWMDAIPPYWEPYREMVYEMVGNPETERELLESASPVFHADNIMAPLLIAQGANDPRVKQEESDQMVEVLRGRGIVVDYIVKSNEGHGFANEENRFDFYRSMENFLGEHLGGAAELPPPSEES